MLQFYSPARRACDEAQRQAAVAALIARGVARPERLDAIVRSIADLFRCPIAAASIVDEDRQWFASSIGLGVSETSRAISFCAHAILSPGQVFCVPDAAKDSRFAGNPLVLGDPNIRFYAGAPLILADGTVAGALCAIDRTPRPGIGIVEATQLRLLASEASAALR